MLENIISKEDFDALCVNIKEDTARFFSNPLDTDSLEALSKRYFTATIAQGIMPEASHIYLYLLYKDKKGVFDGAESIQNALKGALYQEGVGDMEKIMILQALFLCDIISFNAKEGYLFFFKELSKLHIHNTENSGIFETILRFLDDAAFDFDDLKYITETNLEQKIFQSLDDTQKRSIFNWMLHFFWHAKKIHNTRRWLELYPLMRESLYLLIQKDKRDNAMHLQFIIYHFMGNTYQTQAEWRIYNKEIVEPCSEYYKSIAKKYALPLARHNIAPAKKSGKIRIGILKDRLVNNSVFKVEIAFLQSLYDSPAFRERYEVVIYLMNYIEKSFSDEKVMLEYVKLGIVIVDCTSEIILKGYYHDHLEKALAIRNVIQNDEISILLSPNNGYDISDFIIATRTAPRQLYWSHGNFVYDIAELDGRITHIGDVLGKEEKEGFVFECFGIETDNSLVLDEAKYAIERAKYPKEAFILGVIGRLVKVDNEEYLQTIAQILQKNPDTIFIAAGSGSVESIRAKVDALGIGERCYFPGFVDARVYGEIIDLWCNTFPLTQGESFNEYKHLQKPFVCMVKATPEWIEENKNKERRYLYPYTTELYVRYADMLINDSTLRSACVKAYTDELNESAEKSISGFLEILEKLQ